MRAKPAPLVGLMLSMEVLRFEPVNHVRPGLLPMYFSHNHVDPAQRALADQGGISCIQCPGGEYLDNASKTCQTCPTGAKCPRGSAKLPTVRQAVSLMRRKLTA